MSIYAYLLEKNTIAHAHGSKCISIFCFAKLAAYNMIKVIVPCFTSTERYSTEEKEAKAKFKKDIDDYSFHLMFYTLTLYLLS